jgi:CubicO group peptidase (beta-lactamase class C family)
MNKCLVSLVSGLAIATSSVAEVDPHERLDELLDRLAADVSLRGAFLVLNDGEVVFAKGLGTDGGESNRAIDADTRFEVASLAKPLTAVGALTLIDAGRLELSDDVKSYLPDFAFEGVTVRHLLSHTSGLPNQFTFFAMVSTMPSPANNDALIGLLETLDIELEAEPGEAFVYSNLNYWVLARVIEEASGESYSTYLHDHVFVPLEMDRTSVRATIVRPDTVPEGVAVPFVREADGEWAIAGTTESTAWIDELAVTVGDAKITSTARDLAKLLPVVRGEVLLDRDTAALMTTPTKLSTGKMAVGGQWKPFAMGLGWKLSQPGEVWHDGNWGGFVSYASFEPRSGDGLIYLLNQQPDRFDVLPELLSAVEAVQAD